MCCPTPNELLTQLRIVMQPWMIPHLLHCEPLPGVGVEKTFE